MEYGFKVTENGQRLMARCLAGGRELNITRVAVGSGQVEEGRDLSGVSELLEYRGEGSVAEKLCREKSLFLTARFTNFGRIGAGFFLSEFMVYALDPDTREETDFLYATLGDHWQGVPEYEEGAVPSVWSFPMVVEVSSELRVTVTAQSGLLVYEDLLEELKRHNDDPTAHSIRRHVIASRIRSPARPDYGLGGGGEEAAVLLDTGDYTGEGEVSVVVSGMDYDAKNMSAHGESAPDGTLIIQKMEE